MEILQGLLFSLFELSQIAKEGLRYWAISFRGESQEFGLFLHFVIWGFSILGILVLIRIGYYIGGFIGSIPIVSVIRMQIRNGSNCLLGLYGVSLIGCFILFPVLLYLVFTGGWEMR